MPLIQINLSGSAQNRPMEPLVTSLLVDENSREVKRPKTRDYISKYCWYKGRCIWKFVRYIFSRIENILKRSRDFGRPMKLY
ncbi:hypothetical protein DVK00_19130 [Haloarcula sp. Atlit-47R]|nr:hypothetical protein DVK00_19130 [Haloarcula sp. Atlit-47R]